MLYAILGIIIVVALILIFRDDHDGSYNKREKEPRRVQQNQYRRTEPQAGPKVNQPQAGPKVEHPQAEKKATEPSLKDQILGEIEAALAEARKGFDMPMVEEPKSEETVDEEWVDLSFLDTIDYSEDLEENSETFDIAGLRYHCTVQDCGKIVGIVRPEPSNVHDPRAQAVIRSDGKLLGYIPRTQLDWYEDFNEVDVECPFVGVIELDRSSARLIAEIKVIIPTSREFVKKEILAGI